MKYLKAIILIGFIMFYGCSKKNNQSMIDPDTGNHQENWTFDHRAAYIANQKICAQCHGSDFRGGISNVSCFSENFNGTTCHINGPSGHTSGWSDPELHGVTAEKDFSLCKVCHGDDYQGGNSTVSCFKCHNGPGLNHPDSTWIITNHKTSAISDITSCAKCHGTDYLGGGSKIACSNCHVENETKVHPINWYPDVLVNHRSYAITNGVAKCSNAYCHGTTLNGVIDSGPACSTCHVWPLLCNTCHETPPTGTVYPNIAGRHSIHMALANASCLSCHTDAGASTDKHMNSIVDIIFNADYKAKSGTSSFSSQNKTCAKISCHGGQTTPDWVNGAINVNTQCSACHSSGTNEYNSYHSGRHSKHANEGIWCTECHDTNILAVNHFFVLNTTEMTNANLTIISSANYNNGRCTLNCHGEEHDNESW